MTSGNVAGVDPLGVSSATRGPPGPDTRADWWRMGFSLLCSTGLLCRVSLLCRIALEKGFSLLCSTGLLCRTSLLCKIALENGL